MLHKCRTRAARAGRLLSSAGTPALLVRLIAVVLGFVVALGVSAAGAGAKAHRGHRRAGRIHRVTAGVPAHVETWAYDDGCNGGTGAGAWLVREWVTYAESNCGPGTTKARTDCHANGTIHCYVMQYLDTNWDFPEDHMRIASAASGNWLLHAPSSQSVYTSTMGGGYLLNQLVPEVRRFFQSYVRANYNSDDGLLMDWQSPSLAQELYYSTCGCLTTREIPTNQMLQAAHDHMASAMTHRNGAPFIQANNSLPGNPYLPQGLDMLNRARGVDAWVAEGEPESGGVLDPYYSTLLDQIAYISHHTAGFVVLMSEAAAGSTQQQQSRRMDEATILLGYSPGHLVDWADLEQGSSDLAVWPEEGLYPANPEQSMGAPRGRGCLAGLGVVCSRGGHNDLEVAPGVYRREFGACFDRGVRFGPCAAIVNTTGRPVAVRASWLRGVAFGHRIAFAGGDVQSGGTIRVKGLPFHAGKTVVGPQDAILLSQ